MLFLGPTAISAHNEALGAWTVNEISAFGSGGTYPTQFELIPASVCNDTIIAYSNGNIFYSPDGGESWDMFFNNIQTFAGFPEGENIYYFKYHFDNSDNIFSVYFAKKSKNTQVFLSDYELVYEGPYIRSQANGADFRFLKSDDLLFYTHPGVGVVFSNDDGATWGLLTNELAFMFVTSMAATEDYVYFALKQHGVKRMEKNLITQNIEISPTSAPVIFPNPARNTLCFSENQSGRIYDIMGKSVSDFTNNDCIDISNLASGVYLLRFENAQLSTQTFIKN
jgi:hypothetical protein